MSSRKSDYEPQNDRKEAYSLIGKQDSRPFEMAGSKRRREGDLRVFRRRRPRPLLAVVFLLAAVGVLLSAGYLRSDDAESVSRLVTPSVSEAPEMLADMEQRTSADSGEAEAEEERVAPPEDPTLYMTVPRLGVYGHTVRNDDSEWALDQGAIKLPPTGFPWQGGANTYIAGHRIGWPGTESYYQFYDLPAMQNGDLVYLTDTNGTVYTYEVSEIFAVRPDEVWVTNPIAGRDMVTLQTCTETPNDWWTIGPKLYSSGPEAGRLVVRADKIATDYA